tara:strand:- start:4260 stop:5117 length:858 start_codon:yes stop_codon:yes gene_type:complete
LSKNQKNIEFKGLVVYNHISKLVKQSLNEQEIKLRSGKYFQTATRNSFRDLVKRSFDESKGKSKKEVERITLKIVNEGIKEGGYLEQYDFENIAYWELEDFLIDLQLPENQKYEIEQGTIPELELENISGDLFEIGKQLIVTRQKLNKYKSDKKLDSNTVPSFSGFKNKEGVVQVKLIESAGAILYDEQDELAEKLIDSGLKPKPEPAKTKKKIKDELLKDEEVLQAKEKTKQAKEVTRQEQIKTLKLEKESLMDDFRFAKEMGDKKDMKKIKKRIDEIRKIISP